MTDHRFTHDMGGDTLRASAFRRNLRIEHRFVQTAEQVFALALVRAPTAGDRRHLAAILHHLTHEQENYFRAAFAARGRD